MCDVDELARAPRLNGELLHERRLYSAAVPRARRRHARTPGSRPSGLVWITLVAVVIGSVYLLTRDARPVADVPAAQALPTLTPPPPTATRVPPTATRLPSTPTPAPATSTPRPRPTAT